MKRFSVLFLSLALVHSATAGDWSYKGQSGPGNWPGECATGKSQSPIDLPRTGVSERQTDPFKFSNYDVTPKESKLTNTGYTLKLSQWTPSTPDQLPMVTGGGLPGQYAFAQFHYHWGTDNTQGSEHTIGNVMYPMELHLVHYNTKYGNNIGSAIAGGSAKGANDILAVLGMMFQLQNKDNKALDPIIEVLDELSDKDDSISTELFTLFDTLPTNTDEFYRYQGSLTTPGCNEIVVWTVFKNPVPISNRQMAKFRSLAGKNDLMEDNYRPVQPLNGRKVFLMKSSETGSATSITCSLMLAFFATLAARLMH